MGNVQKNFFDTKRDSANALDMAWVNKKIVRFKKFVSIWHCLWSNKHLFDTIFLNIDALSVSTACDPNSMKRHLNFLKWEKKRNRVREQTLNRIITTSVSIVIKLALVFVLFLRTTHRWQLLSALTGNVQYKIHGNKHFWTVSLFEPLQWSRK